MAINRFNRIPDKAAYTLPFRADKKTFAKWLASLPAINEKAACQQILHALQGLDDIKLSRKMKFDFLVLMQAQLESVVKNLNKTFIDATTPLNNHEKGTVEQIVWAYATLGNQFSRCADANVTDKATDPKLNTTALYNGITALSHSLLYMSAVYEQPYDGFWNSCYALYRQAEKLDILGLTVLLNKNTPRTFLQAFKHILVFNACVLNQYRSREILKLYQLLEKYADTALLSKNYPNQQAEYYYAFSLTQDAPPATLRYSDIGQSGETRYLLVYTVAKTIHKNLAQENIGTGQLKAINQALYQRAIKTLSLSYKRQFIRIKEHKLENGIFGFENLVQYLSTVALNKQHQPKLAKDFYHKIAGSWTVPDLDLVPLEDRQLMQKQAANKFEIKHNEQQPNIFAADERTINQDIWDTTYQNNALQADNIFIGEFEILDSSVHGYGLKVNNDRRIKAKVGDLIGIQADAGQRIELGLICRINKPETGKIKFAVELIGMESQPVFVSVPGHAETSLRALFIPGIKQLKQPDCIVFNNSSFTSGEFICLHKDNEVIQCRLEKLLHCTPAVSHIALFYPKTG